MSDCREYQELISRMLDEDLSETESERLHAHVLTCPDCRRTLDAFTMLRDTISEDLQPAPEALAGAVMEQIRREPVSIDKKRRAHVGRWIALAACLAIVAFSASRLNLLFGRKGAAAPQAPEMNQFLLESKAQVATGGAMTPFPADAPASAETTTESVFEDTCDASNAAEDPEEEPTTYYCLLSMDAGTAPETLEYEDESWRLVGYVDELPSDEANAMPMEAAAPDAEVRSEESFSPDLKPILVGDRLYLLLDDGTWAEYEK